MSIAELRKQYHKNICTQVLRVNNGAVNIADTSSRASVAISRSIAEQLGAVTFGHLPGQEAGNLFEDVTRDFLIQSFDLLKHLRPGNWPFGVNIPISQFEQYKHLDHLQNLLQENPELKVVLGEDYLVKPDIIVGKYPFTDGEINKSGLVIASDDKVCRYTPLRETNNSNITLHASISCKWTIRSDRSQNARTEALNLIRNRKGKTPHIVSVTAEPLPTRIAALALGTGDLDCVYHFALDELYNAVAGIKNEDQLEMLSTLIGGGRLRDISDLPMDLAI